MNISIEALEMIRAEGGDATNGPLPAATKGDESNMWRPTGAADELCARKARDEENENNKRERHDGR